MQQIARKCLLGLALENVIKEMNLHGEARKIFQVYYECFMKHYKAFKIDSADSGRIDGTLLEHYEYPIGQDEKLQYFQAYGQMSISSNRKYEQKIASSNSLLEGFSTNDGVKGVKGNKNKGTRNRARVRSFGPEPKKLRKHR